MPIHIITNNNKGNNISEMQTPDKIDHNMLDCVLLHYNYCFLISQTCDMGFTEAVKDDPDKFELWLHGRSEVFVMQVSQLLSILTGRFLPYINPHVNTLCTAFHTFRMLWFIMDILRIKTELVWLTNIFS